MIVRILKSYLKTIIGILKTNEIFMHTDLQIYQTIWKPSGNFFFNSDFKILLLIAFHDFIF